MTIEEHIEMAKEWARGITIHAESQGWRVTCVTLAEEVERLRSRATELEAIQDADTERIHLAVGESRTQAIIIQKISDERDRFRADLEQIKTGLANMPYPRDYPELCTVIDTLYYYTENALKC